MESRAWKKEETFSVSGELWILRSLAVIIGIYKSFRIFLWRIRSRPYFKFLGLIVSTNWFGEVTKVEHSLLKVVIFSNFWMSLLTHLGPSFWSLTFTRDWRYFCSEWKWRSFQLDSMSLLEFIKERFATLCVVLHKNLTPNYLWIALELVLWPLLVHGGLRLGEMGRQLFLGIDWYLYQSLWDLAFRNMDGEAVTVFLVTLLYSTWRRKNNLVYSKPMDFQAVVNHFYRSVKEISEHSKIVSTSNQSSGLPHHWVCLKLMLIQASLMVKRFWLLLIWMIWGRFSGLSPSVVLVTLLMKLKFVFSTGLRKPLKKKGGTMFNGFLTLPLLLMRWCLILNLVDVTLVTNYLERFSMYNWELELNSRSSNRLVNLVVELSFKFDEVFFFNSCFSCDILDEIFNFAPIDSLGFIWLLFSFGLGAFVLKKNVIFYS